MINRMARGFQQAGIKRGSEFAFSLLPCLEFMPIVFALYRVGAIVVLIDPGMGRDGLLSCVERIAPTVMVGVPKAMVATVLFAKVSLATVEDYPWWGNVALGWKESQGCDVR